MAEETYEISSFDTVVYKNKHYCRWKEKIWFKDVWRWVNADWTESQKQALVYFWQVGYSIYWLDSQTEMCICKNSRKCCELFLSIVVVVVNIVPYSFVLSWLLNNNFPLTNFLSLSIVQVPSFKNAIYQIMIKAESGQRSFCLFFKYLVLRTSSWLSFNL